ncbi:MAG: Mut7-C RNAse domain-containing protein [Candidatus Eisenbacteria bacterium]|uniref:Mut7-C RNAse domain-containing protein n=1 Tax=Eiseniibacteriota bacterium TaxID=2212470 RepID=A0A948W6J9_UNCEI|nr:Mut7-C RNAse domain-containing protein [Candidatus Eisenbacteria bacterium]MBU1947170.1 Mut7-C RNAse domain-containing protein [Candidatus Eisenbacteria bacterium]MBU2691210.1 Mut7-C RNAse domain-containing protein [Candidatus Eisenbacteria bacterium]
MSIPTLPGSKPFRQNGAILAFLPFFHKPSIWVCDETVVRLGRELRALGCETSIFSGGRLPKEPPPILLTRSHRLLADRDLSFLPPTILLKSDRVGDQLRDLDRIAKINRILRPWTLCIRCGGPLNRHSPEKFRGAVPDYVVASTRWIGRCERCGHLFWRATQTSKQEAFWREIFGSRFPIGAADAPSS